MAAVRRCLWPRLVAMGPALPRSLCCRRSISSTTNTTTNASRNIGNASSPRPWTGYMASACAGALLSGSLFYLAASREQQQPLSPSASHMQYADRETMVKAARKIQQLLGEDAVSFDDDELERHGYSEWSTSNTPTRPVAIVFPCSTEQVSAVAKVCHEYRVPMVPFGAGSSVEGNFSSPFSGICIDLSSMDKIIAIREDDMDVTVQAGVNWVNLNAELKSSGLFLPLDPSPTALIGGMVATNCSGTNAFRYGTMKDWVINLTVVLADGTVLKTRKRPRKTSAGYNLNALFTGSEGTLGIVTEATLKLAVVPEAFRVATVTFPSVEYAAKAASQMVRRGIQLAAVEMMDEVQMKVINQNGGAGGRLREELPTLFLKFSGNLHAIETNISQVKTIASRNQGSNFTVAASEKDSDSLWAARKEALWAMLAVRPKGTQIWSTDVAVPISRLAEIIDISKARASRLGLFSSVLGHVGDGNFHQSVMYDPEVPGQKEGVQKCVEEMMITALEMEGTVSGEHGIGLGKKDCLMKELGPTTIEVMKTLKRSLDPHWLLNPSKVFD